MDSSLSTSGMPKSRTVLGQQEGWSWAEQGVSGRAVQGEGLQEPPHLCCLSPGWQVLLAQGSCPYLQVSDVSTHAW